MRSGFTPDLEPWADGRAATTPRPGCRLARRQPGGVGGLHPAGGVRLSRLTDAYADDGDPEEVVHPFLAAASAAAPSPVPRWPARVGAKRRHTLCGLAFVYWASVQ